MISSLNFDFLIFWNIAKNKYVAEYDEDYNGEDLEMSGVNIERGKLWSIHQSSIIPLRMNINIQRT